MSKRKAEKRFANGGSEVLRKKVRGTKEEVWGNEASGEEIFQLCRI